MTSPDDLKAILDRIAAGKHTKADIAALHAAVIFNGDQTVVQLGSSNINIGDIGQARDIHIGDHLYQGTSAESILKVLRQLREENNTNRKRLFGAIFAAIVVIAFIILFFNPPSDENLLRSSIFIVSFSAGVSAVIVLDSFALEVEIPLSKLAIRLIGGLATFLVVLLLSWWTIPSVIAPGIRRGPIELDYVTGINHYPVLALLEENIPKELTEALKKLEGTPLLDTDNPVYENIKKFANESGNRKTISQENRYSHYYERHQGGRNYKGDAGDLNNGESVAAQNKNNFYETNRNDNGEIEEFQYAPVLLPIQTESENADYTSILTTSMQNFDGVGQILQYPKLADLKIFGIKDDSSYYYNPNLDDFWMKNILKANPNIRGFIGYLYSFLNNLPDENLFDICGIYTVRRILPTPYIRFSYIQNISKYPINIESINYKIVGENSNPYKLTEVDKRNDMFLKVPIQTKKFESKGIKLSPKEYLIIPIEFGFDNESLKKNFISTANKILNFSIFDKPVYIYRPINPNNFEKTISKSKEIKIIPEPVSFTKEFISKTRNATNLLALIPNRFAVGTSMQIVSVKVNNRDIRADLPKNRATGIKLGANYQSGSCPYLLISNSQNGHWIELGTVLYNRNKKSLQDYEIHNLGHNISKIKIEEREAEITYIDSVSILYTDPDTKLTQEAIHPIPKLAKQDRDYLLLHQGESMEIDLENLIPADSLDVRLKINGYYEILLDDNSLRTKAKTI